MDELLGPIAALRKAYHRRRASPVEVTRALLARAERLQPALNAFITLTPERALVQARAAERHLARGEGERLPLLGVPITLKDVFDQRGVPTTAGSVLLRDAIPPADAAAVRRLFRAGAVSLGKTNMHELAWGGTCLNPHFGAVRNPWDRERIAGGSSGGAAAAIAAGIGLAGMGSDTVGSIRVPAALCGVVGLKPTYGLVPTAGMVPLYPSLGCAGPLVRTVADAATILAVIGRGAGARPAAWEPERAGLDAGVAGLRVGLVVRHRADADPEVIAAVDVAASVLEWLGARLVPVRWPALPSVDGLAAEAAATHHAAFAANPDGIGTDVRRNLERGLAVRAVDYLAGQRTLRELRRRADVLFDGADGQPVGVLLGPTVPRTATPIADPDAALGWMTRCTRVYNETGLPAISVPCGFSTTGLPIGLQIAGRRFDEATVLRVALAYEQATDWHRRRPPDPAMGPVAMSPA